MENASIMQKEIENKRRLPKEIKDKINSMISYNVLFAISIISYMCIINWIFLNMSENIFDICAKISPILIVLATVAIFEIAYRKDSLKICITGIEFLVYSIIVLYMRYIYLFTNPVYRCIFMFIPIFIAIYCFTKILIIYLKIRSDYKNNLSDIKELLTEKHEGYLHEESTKTLKKQKELKEKQKLENQKQVKNTKKENISDKKTNNTTKKKQSPNGKSKQTSSAKKKQTKKK